jgi:hypothetical protein
MSSLSANQNELGKMNLFKPKTQLDRHPADLFGLGVLRLDGALRISAEYGLRGLMAVCRDAG